MYLKKVCFHLLLSLFFLATFFVGSGQFYEYGQDAGTIKWMQFSSQHYKLIYPRGLDSLAMSFADRLEYYYPHQAEVLQHSHPKMPVVVHNESSFSNGVFVWAPKRLEIFTNPDPNSYPQDWLTQLAIHEGRHAVQVSKLDQGFARGLSFIGGEQAVGAITGFLPLWYLEGDAVDAETRFSQSGRGRLPSFEMGMKALLLEKEKRYHFSKAILGSYKDHVPNHYELGYLMVRYGRRTYGDQFWIDMEDYAARKPFLIFPTYFSMLKYGVKSKKAFYNSSLDLYEEHWKKQYNDRKILPVRPWNSENKQHFTNYTFPQVLDEENILALKSGVDQIPEFVRIDSLGNEERIFRPGYMNSGRFSYRKNMIVWDEWSPGMRWSNRNFSVLRLYDLEKGSVRNLGARTRYYAPSFSHSGETIVCIEQRTDQTFYLVVLDLNGKVIQSIQSRHGLHIQHPAWMENDSAIILIESHQDGESLVSYSLESGKWAEVYHSGFDDISYPSVNASSVYFSSTISGIDNIYCFNLEEQGLFQVSSAGFGAFEPSLSASGSVLLYSDYHSDGYNAVSMELDPSKFISTSLRPPKTEQLDHAATPEEEKIIEGARDIQAGSYSAKPYRKLQNSVNIHSWLPLYFDYMNPEAALSPEYLPVSLGASILSQNLLSTVTAMLGYEYREKTHYLHSGVRLKGRLPVFDLNLNYGGLPLVYKINSTDNIALNPDRLRFSASAYIPLRLSTGKYISIVQPLMNWTYSSDLYPNEESTAYEAGTHWFLYRFYVSSYLRMGRKEILPRLGFVFSASYRNAPFNAHNFGPLSYASLNLYLPGPLRHQTLKLRVAAQSQDPVRYLLANTIPVPRGYENENILGTDLKLYSADYVFPLLYPDLNIEPFVYIKRIRGAVWVDHMRGKEVYNNDPDDPDFTDRNFTSCGADLVFDFHPLRIAFPFSMGVRMSYLPASGKWLPNLLFEIDVN